MFPLFRVKRAQNSRCCPPRSGALPEFQAGTTPEERGSFDQLLRDTGFADTFRVIHGDGVRGVFSYWSVRAGNRQYNRGLRLDYFLASPAAATRGCVLDAFVLDHVAGSDHCPVGIDLRL